MGIVDCDSANWHVPSWDQTFDIDDLIKDTYFRSLKKKIETKPEQMKQAKKEDVLEVAKCLMQGGSITLTDIKERPNSVLEAISNFLLELERQSGSV